MSISTMEKLQAAFKKKENDGKTSRPNNYYPFWNIPEGSQAIVRFLPDANEDNPMGFMVEKFMHPLMVNGQKENIPCNKMYDEECPICKVSASYYKEEDKVNGKKYWRKKQHLAQAIIIEDPLPPNADTGETHEGKVRFLALGFQIFNVIKDTFESGELDAVPYAYEGGTDFVIKKSTQGEHASYSLSKFSRKSNDLSDDQISMAQEQMIDISTLLPKQESDAKVAGLLEASLTGGEYQDNKESSSTNFKSVKKEETPTPAAAKEESQDALGASESTDDGEYDDEANKILAQIRARQAKKA